MQCHVCRMHLMLHSNRCTARVSEAHRTQTSGWNLHAYTRRAGTTGVAMAASEQREEAEVDRDARLRSRVIRPEDARHKLDKDPDHVNRRASFLNSADELLRADPELDRRDAPQVSPVPVDSNVEVNTSYIEVADEGLDKADELDNPDKEYCCGPTQCVLQ